MSRLTVAMDSWATSSRMSLYAPLHHLDRDVVLVAPEPMPHLDGWDIVTLPLSHALDHLESGAVLSTGHYLPIGAAAYQRCRASGARFVSVQHGLLTPHAPPLARETTLLAWSEADGEFWRSGREDVTVRTVGSPLLWAAAHAPPASPHPGDRPVYLGQLHGAELPRKAMARSAEAFCVATGAAYRPHPAETDRLSRSFHRHLEGKGVDVDRSGTPLADLGRPVVSAFSTGVLEAAARGLPAWVDFVDPPPWLEAFWRRYGMSRWGGDPTPAPAVPEVEPAMAIAQVLREMMEE